MALLDSLVSVEKARREARLGEEGETRREDGVRGRILMVDRWYLAGL